MPSMSASMISSLELTTPRLVLVAGTLEHVEAELQGRDALRSMLGATVPEDWPPGEYDRDAQEFFRGRLAGGGPAMVGWITWYGITRSPAGAREALVAGAGFFGPPSEGVVEIGYSVVPGARGAGYATEIVAALCTFAFSHDAVQTVIAHTTPDNVPSQRVLLKCGFTEAPAASPPGDLEYTLRRASSSLPA